MPGRRRRRRAALYRDSRPGLRTGPAARRRGRAGSRKQLSARPGAPPRRAGPAAAAAARGSGRRRACARPGAQLPLQEHRPRPRRRPGPRLDHRAEGPGHASWARAPGTRRKGARAGRGHAQHAGPGPRAGDTWRDAGTTGCGPHSPGHSRQAASRRAFHSTFSPISEAKGRSRGVLHELQLGALQRFREMGEPREESRESVQQPAVLAGVPPLDQSRLYGWAAWQ